MKPYNRKKYKLDKVSSVVSLCGNGLLSQRHPEECLSDIYHCSYCLLVSKAARKTKHDVSLVVLVAAGDCHCKATYGNERNGYLAFSLTLCFLMYLRAHAAEN